MAKYVYPAIFTKEESGMFAINFPDLESCYTSGESLKDGIFMAEDVLAYVLYDYEKDSKKIPEPSLLTDISLNENEFVNFIACDTMEYRKMHSSKAVKKTLTIPEWLNAEAEKAGVNYSKLLQDALVKTLNLKS